MSIVRGAPWPEPGEPLWPEIDLDVHLAYRRHIAELCQSCGTRPADFLDEHGRLLRNPPYEAQLHTCPGCEMREELADQVRNENDGRIPPHYRIVLAPHYPDPEEA